MEKHKIELKWVEKIFVLSFASIAIDIFG